MNTKGGEGGCSGTRQASILLVNLVFMGLMQLRDQVASCTEAVCWQLQVLRWKWSAEVPIDERYSMGARGNLSRHNLS